MILPEAASRPDECEVWEENWQSLLFFLKIETQWRVSMNGLIGLDYGVVLSLLNLYQVADPVAVLEDLQIMEKAVLSAMQKEN